MATTTGQRLKQIREMQGMSQTAFAKAIGLSHGYITTLENDKQELSNRLITIVSSTFHVDPEWLRTGEGSMALSDLSKEYAAQYLRIQKAMCPSCQYPNQILELMEYPVSSDIFNYIAHRMLDAPDKHEADRIAALFAVAFPDYKTVVAKLRAGSASRSHDIAACDLSQHCCMNVAGKAAAGQPLFDDSPDVQISVPQKYLDGRFFIVQANGNSMEPRVNDGDYVVVQKDVQPMPGELALVCVDGEYAIKLVSYDRRKDMVLLHSINTDYEVMQYPLSSVGTIEKIVYIIRR